MQRSRNIHCDDGYIILSKHFYNFRGFFSVVLQLHIQSQRFFVVFSNIVVYSLCHPSEAQYIHLRR